MRIQFVLEDGTVLHEDQLGVEFTGAFMEGTVLSLPVSARKPRPEIAIINGQFVSVAEDGMKEPQYTVICRWVRMFDGQPGYVNADMVITLDPIFPAGEHG